VAWFKKKPSELERLAGLADEVRDTAIRRFAERGRPVTLVDGTSGMEAVLATADGYSYPLHNLISMVMAGRLDDVQPRVIAHVDGLMDAAAAPSSDELSDADWFTLVRVRLMPNDAATTVSADYARRVAEDFSVMLCLDYPTHVSFVSGGTLGDRDPDALASVGLASVMEEPVDRVAEIDPGVWLIEGQSPYTATKVLGMQHLVGSVLPAAPNGVVFGVPHRHAIVAHAVMGVEAVQAIASLASLVRGNATDSAPGGELSTSLYFWHEGVIDVVGRVGESGRMEIDGSGRLGAILEQLLD
jgi:hypothetical protein